jgi:hypothetical protein
VVGWNVGVNLGELVRPGLVLLIEYALVAASVSDVWRARNLGAGAPAIGPQRGSGDLGIAAQAH